jgi:hypothetical protein
MAVCGHKLLRLHWATSPIGPRVMKTSAETGVVHAGTAVQRGLDVYRVDQSEVGVAVDVVAVLRRNAFAGCFGRQVAPKAREALLDVAIRPKTLVLGERLRVPSDAPHVEGRRGTHPGNRVDCLDSWAARCRFAAGGDGRTSDHGNYQRERKYSPMAPRGVDERCHKSCN